MLVDEAASVLGSALDARRIAEAVTGYAGAEWYEVLDAEALGRHVARFDALVARRAAGEPLQYVVGSWGFRTLDLMVDRRVLIPRPETEVVVGEALRLAAGLPRPLVAVDLGTGSGAIALSLAAELRGEVEVWATDRSEAALDVARANLAGLGRMAGRVRLAAGDWFDALPPDLVGRVGLVVSNPPYVAEAEVAALAAEVVGWEPREALVAGPTGLECVARVLAGCRAWLAPRAVVVVEVGDTQAEAVADMARRLGFAEVAVRGDLAGRDRMLVATTGIGSSHPNS